MAPFVHPVRGGISTHTPLARRDNSNRQRTDSNDQRFQLTRLLRGVTALQTIGATKVEISTHTPLARRDSYTDYILRLAHTYFNSHASCEA